jgi:site-specific DNA-methyltransferase (adenine-specific)
MDNDRWVVAEGDSLDNLRALPENYLDAVVTDPPAGIDFMGKDWDHHKGGRDQWIAWLTAIMAEALRVTKPGGHALVWALPRTAHWTATAIENAGWEIRDRIHDLQAGDTALNAFIDTLEPDQRAALVQLLESQSSPVLLHLFGQGFPKSQNVSLMLDKAAGAKREVVGTQKLTGTARIKDTIGARTSAGHNGYSESEIRTERDLTAPATDLAKQWAGWGTALKPAAEHWILARKPLVGTVAANVTAHGTGAMNIDASRVAAEPELAKNWQRHQSTAANGSVAMGSGLQAIDLREYTPDGRWPPHVLLTHSDGCRVVGKRKVKTGNSNVTDSVQSSIYGVGIGTKVGKHYADDDGTETVDQWECVDGCPVKALDEQSGTSPVNGRVNRKGKTGYGFGDDGYGEGGNVTPQYYDTGGASRFFPQFTAPFQYQAKPSPKERNMGLENLPERTAGAYGEFAGDGRGRQTEHRPAANHHPTVKSVMLMTWLVRLVTRPGGRVGDPFCGSGSTGVACVLGGWEFWGSELDPEYAAIARARIAHAVAHPDLWKPFLKPALQRAVVAAETTGPADPPTDTPQPAPSPSEGPQAAAIVARAPGKRGRKKTPEGVEQLLLF